ncbi:MAG: LysM peptidoglycan-binding domain-containing protein [Treponema sp.]|nr:LysM peptidoglycan-binding domain-containing protein [Treponema sp.]
MPWELLYLPVVESAFVPSALSRSGAMGLWQFMMNSIDPFNIQVTEWVDERRDFWISTQGALAKLQDNYAFFEDWKLALAAYNAGLGALNRMIQESGVRDYWGLADRNQLRAETRHYVPRLLAVTQIMSNPRRYGMEVYWPQDPQWMRLELGRPVDLRILSELAGLNEEILLGANTELRYHVTPPGGGYYLKFPALYEEQIKHTLARTDVEFIRHYVHTIQSGDTLLALARHYGATVDQILGANPGTQERFLRIGSRLLIPALTEAGPPPRAASTGLGTLIFSGEHRVQQGETLWSISRSYGIDPETLAEANGMAVNDILREGRILRTPAR